MFQLKENVDLFESEFIDESISTLDLQRCITIGWGVRNPGENNGVCVCIFYVLALCKRKAD